MNLTKEQLEIIKAKIEELESDIDSLEKDASENYAIRLVKTAELKDLNKMILEAVTLTINNEEVIGLGSKFSASFYFPDEEPEAADYLLCEKNIKVPGYTVVTSNSPFGKAVIGKKENEKISYFANGIKLDVIVNKIYNDKKLEQPKVLGLNK